jgi:hypothetical protein
MNRRDALRSFGIAAGATALPYLRPRFEYLDLPHDDHDILRHVEHLRGEPKAASAVRIERGGPRLFVNGKEEYPLLAGSSGLIHTIKSFKASGIKFFHPLISLENGWMGPGKYDWDPVDRYFAKLLSIVPDAFFLPRLHLYAPTWWKDAHPEELVQYGLPVDKTQYKMGNLTIDSGFDWNCVFDAYSASLASDVWKKDMGEVLRDFLQHMELSPLRSRMIGYHFVGAMTAEWHYVGSRYLPDYSTPMQHTAGPVPSAEARIRATNGLLRDPEKEREVMEFYRKFHENTADTVVYFAGIVKEATERRVVCGTFFAYVMENVCIQEAGHLMPEKVLNCNDIDYLASPYTYQHSNVPGNPRWESDVVDDAGNWLGRARGVGGDGGYRVLLESLRRHNKLFIGELDPSTYLEPEKTTEGGSGFSTVEGTLRILGRDLAQVFANGNGGWLFEFGHVPTFKANRGWYDDAPMIKEIRKWADLGHTNRKRLDVRSVAEIAAVYDVKTFLATQHWKAEEPWKGFGISITDFFNHWLVNSQARTLHCIGAPMDFLYRFDLVPHDISRYKLFFMPNLFYLTTHEARRLKDLLKGSGTTVVWFYAPGYITPDRFDLAQMEDLTGFAFKRIDEPGPMMIECKIDKPGLKFFSKFGVKKEHFPRFAVTGNDPTVQSLGRWTDNGDIAFARREYEGFKSLYVGTGPVPVEILRWLAGQSSVHLWSSKPDNIRATLDAAMIVASDRGERVLQFPQPLAPAEGGAASRMHRLVMEFGDVKVFVKR